MKGQGIRGLRLRWNFALPVNCPPGAGGGGLGVEDDFGVEDFHGLDVVFE